MTISTEIKNKMKDDLWDIIERFFSDNGLEITLEGIEEWEDGSEHEAFCVDIAKNFKLDYDSVYEYTESLILANKEVLTGPVTDAVTAGKEYDRQKEIEWNRKQKLWRRKIAKEQWKQLSKRRNSKDYAHDVANEMAEIMRSFARCF